MSVSEGAGTAVAGEAFEFIETPMHSGIKGCATRQ